MKRSLLSLFTACFIAACASVEVDVWDSDEFAAGGFKTYAWRSEPFESNFYYSRDAIYVIDPILRDVVDEKLAAKGYKRVEREGDFTVDYIFAPGIRLGAPAGQATNVASRAGIRPNTNISQAERDNVIALGGVKETRNIALQFNSGDTGREVWRGVITKIVANANDPDRGRAERLLGIGVGRAFRDLPKADSS
ncbi:MAG: DUF4136 domain-containing protein [Pseudomonadota bacterium]